MSSHERAYILTPRVRRRLESLGFVLKCGRCGRSFEDGEKILPKKVGTRTRRFYHTGCWSSLYYSDQHNSLTFDFVKQKRQFTQVVPGYHKREPVPHMTLRRGHYSSNPGEVLCPTLSKHGTCMKREGDSTSPFARPKLLLKHHANPNLQLWYCSGCPEFLLRVERDG